MILREPGMPWEVYPSLGYPVKGIPAVYGCFNPSSQKSHGGIVPQMGGTCLGEDVHAFLSILLLTHSV